MTRSHLWNLSISLLAVSTSNKACMLLQVLRPYVHEEPLPFSFPDLFPVLPKRRHKMTKKSFRLVTGVVLLLTPLLFSLFFTLLQLTFGYPAILSAVLATWIIRSKTGTSRRRKISFSLLANPGGSVYNQTSSTAYSCLNTNNFT